MGCDWILRRSRRGAQDFAQKEGESPRPGATHVLPMERQIGNPLMDGTGVWELIGRPYTSPNGKTVDARVQRVGQFGSTMLFGRGAYERVSVKRPTSTA